MDWRPIETAPKDGTFIIGATKSQWQNLRPFPYPLKVRWGNGRWLADDDKPYDPQPTHWHPVADAS